MNLTALLIALPLASSPLIYLASRARTSARAAERTSWWLSLGVLLVLWGLWLRAALTLSTGETLSVTLGLLALRVDGLSLFFALVVLGAFSYYGFKEQGFGFITHLFGPWMGPAMIPINILIFAIEFLSTFIIRPVTLSIRLMLNIAVDHPAAAGYITAYPCGSPRPLAANLNYAADQTIPNAVLVKVGAGGKVCLYSMSATHLVADVDGYVTAGSAFVQAVQPARLLDTRPGYATVDGLHQATDHLVAGGTITLDVTGRGGVPKLATAVVLNVTATGSSAPGYITAFPCGEPRPVAAGLNYAAGQTIANAVTVKVGASGTVCLFAYSATDLVVDVDGFTL